ncbi:LacI family DNA-binding transcriptional regulator [Roseobacter sp.]|uniref:LacI family DNA-binding transcriptional regulator n=1 Tax=Roseobacter sp. TaxID=1907202 RepID=UPI002966CBD4|nr:LacI family DNA-binding transcriptional regulator [Roseobacter sp.]MDW3183395.1 LacI family DNA-binding transcriptional regulator [Roseobacter sp.]
MGPRHRKTRSNMRDVAEKAGVSVATVSRVLSGADGVLETTRERVQQAAEELSFVPSPAARAINSGRTYMVGALVPTLDHAIFARYIEALEMELVKQGFSLVVATTGGDPIREAERAENLLDLGVEGLFVSGITRGGGFEALVARRKVPVIATSYFKVDHSLPTIGYDNAKVASMALEHLHALGHRQIGVLSGFSQDNDRTAARLTGIERHGMTGLQFAQSAIDYDAAGDSAAALLDRHPRLTGLLCLSDVLAQGALFRLQRMGVQVPTDISIIGIDDLPGSASTFPALTSVRLPVAEMGRQAAAALAHWIEEGERPTSVELEGQISRRQSTRAIAS